MAISNQPLIVPRRRAAIPAQLPIWLRGPNAYLLPELSEGVHLPEARHGDALRLKLAGVETESLIAVGTIPGVAVLAAGGRNGPGVGCLRASGDGTLLSWCAPGSNRFGSTTDCSVDGNHLLEDGRYPGKWLRVQVYNTYMNPGVAEAKVFLADVYNNGPGHDDLSAAEAAAGDIEDYTISLTNDSPMDILHVKAWLEVGTARIIEISSDDANYYSPTYEDHINTLSWARIASGASETLYLRRTITAGADSDPGVLNHLQFAFDSI